MDHLVRFSTAVGREGQHTADSLAEALKFVERLRNNEDVSDVRVFRMQEVPISFRTYYRVEVSADGEDGAELAGEDGRMGGAMAHQPPMAPAAGVAGVAGHAMAPAPMAPAGASAPVVLGGAVAGNGGHANGHGPAGGEGGHSDGGRRRFSR